MNVKQDATDVIEQVCDLLHRLDDDMYAQPLEVFSDSTIGQHVRHIYGFYACLIKGAKEGLINYDKRERDLRIQTETHYCDDCFCDLISDIHALDLYQPVKVLQGMNAPDEPNGEAMTSSVGRELLYAFEHSIHHLAIVKMGLRVHFPDFEVNPNLGVAPSTIEYREACAQ